MHRVYGTLLKIGRVSLEANIFIYDHVNFVKSNKKIYFTMDISDILLEPKLTNTSPDFGKPPEKQNKVCILYTKI